MANSGLGGLLVERGILSEGDRRTLIKTSGHRSGAFARKVMANGVMDEEELAAFFASQTHHRLASKDLTQEMSDSAGTAVPLSLLRELEVVPLVLEKGHLTVAMLDPLDSETIRQLEFFTGYKIKPVIATLSQIHVALSHLIADFTPPMDTDIEEQDATPAPETDPVLDPPLHDTDDMSPAPVVASLASLNVLPFSEPVSRLNHGLVAISLAATIDQAARVLAMSAAEAQATEGMLLEVKGGAPIGLGYWKSQPQAGLSYSALDSELLNSPDIIAALGSLEAGRATVCPPELADIFVGIMDQWNEGHPPLYALRSTGGGRDLVLLLALKDIAELAPSTRDVFLLAMQAVAAKPS